MYISFQVFVLNKILLYVWWTANSPLLIFGCTSISNNFTEYKSPDQSKEGPSVLTLDHILEECPKTIF